MTFVDTFTPMADHLRSEYGITDKLTTSQLKFGINGLHVHNYVTDGLTFDSTSVKTGEWKAIQGITIDSWNALSGKTVAISMDVTWSNYKAVNNQSNRLGFEYGVHYSKSATKWVGLWLNPPTESGTKHCVSIMKLPNDTATSWEEGFFYNQVNSDCKFKVTNIKIVENPMGGVVSTNLFDIMKIEFDPQIDITREGTLFRFNAQKMMSYGYVDFIEIPVKLIPHKKYQLSFTARGNGKVRTYVYGHVANGNYYENLSEWELTNDWKSYTYYLNPETIPTESDSHFSFQTHEIMSGEVTDLKLIEL